ncbi:MAG: hypothetical protein JSS58_05985 [Proteobacteria bacterium]|nr:hypothetical protein [Pseudomonadota bacterium]
MSFLAVAIPVEAAVANLPLLARSALGFGIFGAIISLTLAFKPLLKGLWQALLLALKPRHHLQAGRAHAAALLQTLACDFEANQPSQAEELRRLASRG